MAITDDNTLEDIAGVIWRLQADLDTQTPEFPLAPRFDKLLERIELKLSRNKNKIRHNWFSTALDYAKAAHAAFTTGQPKTRTETRRSAGNILNRETRRTDERSPFWWLKTAPRIRRSPSETFQQTAQSRRVRPSRNVRIRLRAVAEQWARTGG